MAELRAVQRPPDAPSSTFLAHGGCRKRTIGAVTRVRLKLDEQKIDESAD